MLTEREQKKSASYAIEMMLKLSNCFEQMSTICRTAVIEFTKDLNMKEEYEQIAKYRIMDELKRQAIIQKTVSNIEEKIKNVEENLPKRSIGSRNKTRSKRPVQLQAITVSSVQKQKQESLLPSKQQYIQRKSRPKDQILEQKNQPIERKRVMRQNRKIFPKPSIQQSSSLSSQPSDYKSRNKKKSSKSRVKRSRVKRIKDPSKRRPINGFISFFVDIKDQLKEKYHVKTVPEMSHYASIEWKKLSPEEQQKYNNIYYENLEKNNIGEKDEEIQLERKNERKIEKKEGRTYRKVKRPEKESPTENENESSSSSGSSSSGNDSSNSNNSNSQSSSPEESSQIKKKSKKAVIMKDKDVREGREFKIELGKQ